MKLKEITNLINGEILNKEVFYDVEVAYAFGGDMMSDVLMFLKMLPDDFFKKAILLTGNVSVQAIKTAELLGFPAVIFLRGKVPGKIVTDYATSQNISVIVSKDALFTASGKLYKNNVIGFSDYFNGNL